MSQSQYTLCYIAQALIHPAKSSAVFYELKSVLFNCRGQWAPAVRVKNRWNKLKLMQTLRLELELELELESELGYRGQRLRGCHSVYSDRAELGAVRL